MSMGNHPTQSWHTKENTTLLGDMQTYNHTPAPAPSAKGNIFKAFCFDCFVWSNSASHLVGNWFVGTQKLHDGFVCRWMLSAGKRFGLVGICKFQRCISILILQIRHKHEKNKAYCDFGLHHMLSKCQTSASREIILEDIFLSPSSSARKHASPLKLGLLSTRGAIWLHHFHKSWRPGSFQCQDGTSSTRCQVDSWHPVTSMNESTWAMRATEISTIRRSHKTGWWCTVMVVCRKYDYVRCQQYKHTITHSLNMAKARLHQQSLFAKHCINVCLEFNQQFGTGWAAGPIHAP